MNLRVSLLIFNILVLSYAVSYAQHDYTFKFADTKFYLAQNFYKGLRVLDERKDKEDIGILKTGAFNRAANIIPEKNIENLLSDYFEKIQTNKPKGGDELVLVLYGMRIEDRPNGAEMGTFHFDGDFYSSNAGGYAFLGKIDSIFEVQSKWDVSKKLIELAQNKINDFFSMFAAINPNSVEHAQFAETTLLNRRKQEKLTFPIYKTDTYKTGVYYSVDQFINNEPTDTPYVKEMMYNGDQKQALFYYPNKNGKRGKPMKGADIFAIYDGGAWYVWCGGRWVVMTHKDGDFYATQEFEGISNNSSAMEAGLMFGLAGALVASAAEGNHKGTGFYRSKFDPVRKDFVPFKRVH